MRLSRVTLKSPYRVPGSKMDGASCDLTETNVGAMFYDADTGSLFFEDHGFGINWSRVEEWWPKYRKTCCQWCGEEFRGRQALGGHLGHCKARLKAG